MMFKGDSKDCRLFLTGEYTNYAKIIYWAKPGYNAEVVSEPTNPK